MLLGDKKGPFHETHASSASAGEVLHKSRRWKRMAPIIRQHNTVKMARAKSAQKEAGSR
jgi:hypothetical protein